MGGYVDVNFVLSILEIEKKMANKSDFIFRDTFVRKLSMDDFTSAEHYSPQLYWNSFYKGGEENYDSVMMETNPLNKNVGRHNPAREYRTSSSRVWEYEQGHGRDVSAKKEMDVVMEEEQPVMETKEEVEESAQVSQEASADNGEKDMPMNDKTGEVTEHKEENEVPDEPLLEQEEKEEEPEPNPLHRQ